MARHLGGQLGEALLGDRVAVDADQRAGRPEPFGEEPGMPTAAEGAVDGDLARPRIDEVDQLTGEHRGVRRGHVK